MNFGVISRVKNQNNPVRRAVEVNKISAPQLNNFIRGKAKNKENIQFRNSHKIQSKQLTGNESI